MVSPDDPTVAGETCPTCGRTIPSGKPCPDCSATAADEGWEPGTEFTGPRRIAGYRILRELGAGGMGTVFEAFEEKMNRHVALKVLSRHSSPSARADKRFEQEAWIAGSLDHPNLVKVYERGTWEELSYFSMELVDGGSLHDVVENMKRWGRDDRWGLEFGSREYVTWAIRQVVATARGLDYAHRRGVVHRDVKPMNLLLSRELGAVKIADFGLAIDNEVSRMTTEGKILGTLAYMAPEQILGKRDEIGAETDIYALGVTLFELLTLELPYTGDTQQLYLNNVLSVEARRPRKLNNRVSHDLETVIRKALEKSPKDRYGSADELADDLENVLHLRPIEAKAPGAATHLAKWVRRKPVHAALILTLAVGVPIVAGLGLRAVQQRKVTREAQVVDLLRETRWFMEADRFDEALANVARVLERDPGSLAALRHRAVTYMKLYQRRRGVGPETNSPEAASLRERALADADRLILAEPELAWTHATKAYLMRELGLAEEARAEQALAERYRSEVPSSDELHYAAELAMDEGDYERAIELFDEWYTRDRSNSGAIARRAQAYEGLGQYDVALNEYRLAVAINPGQYLTKIDIARLETERGNLEQAEPWLREALEQSPESAIGYETLSFNLLRQGQASVSGGRTDEALARLREGESAARRSLQLNPEQLYARLNLSGLLLELNRQLPQGDPTLLAEAVELFEDLLGRWDRMPEGEQAGMYAGALINRCDALILMDELERALTACFDVTARVPDDPIGFYNLAAVYALLGRTDDALAALERDFELGDTDWGYLESDAWFESLRDDPRFIDLLDRMKRAAAGRARLSGTARTRTPA